MTYNTAQEEFWAGAFGDDYLCRNQSDSLLAANLNLFSRALRSAQRPETCIEFGANIGMNLRALQLLFPGQQQHAVEINPQAFSELSKVIPPTHAWQGAIADFEVERNWELVLIKGVLIHVNPEQLSVVYDKLVAATSRYLLVAEYYNPVPVAISYRGHNERLFKRDFAGELLDRYPTLSLLDYGFIYHRDQNFPQDDVNWFLLEKHSA
jgi:pseudaminic acid biosynthesis-associated methylase